MISYDRYKNRIRKLAAVKNFVVRFRALFIAGLSLVIALITAFLATKGIVTGELSLSVTDIQYGDSYEVEPVTALFSSVSYEFATEDGEDWSAKKPDKAGKYRVRTVTDKAFGVGYGTPLSFEISPRPTEITITQENVTYGDDPSNFTCPLVNGDTLAVVGFRFDSFETNITTVSANAETVKITDKAGEDVTYCYALSTPVKEVTLAPKRVSFAPRAAEYTYGGAPLTYESLLSDAALTELAAGDTAEIETEIFNAGGEKVEAPEFAGDYTVKISSVKIMNGNTDVTALYDWASGAKTAKITVAKRAVTVISADDTKEYDATPLKNSNVTVENLAETDYLSVGLTSELINAGNTKNHVQAWGIFREGEEYLPVGDCYDVTFVEGTLTVTPRAITIITADDTKDYDGKPLGNKNFTMNPAPVDGHEITLSGAQAEITEIGETDNTFAVKIADSEGSPVTGNYAIAYEYGKLTVTPKALTFTAETITKVYDGAALHAYGSVLSGLAEGERVEIDGDASSWQLTAGETDNMPVFRTYRIESGKETTNNYTPTLSGERGKLVVEKRKVSVRTQSQEFIYNGGDQLHPYADIFLADTEEEGLAPNQTYVAVIGEGGLIRGVGSKENVFALEFYEGDDNVTENYDIGDRYEYGTLTVTKRYLHITTGTKLDEEYDGKPFSYTDPASFVTRGDGSENSGLVFIHSLTADTKREIASVTNVEEENVKNIFACRVWDDEGKEVTENYTIEYGYGFINRTPRVVTVLTDDAETEYDGQAMQKLSWTGGERILTEFGHVLTLDENRKDDFGSIVYGYDEEGNKLSAENALYFVVKKGEEDISYNYRLQVTFGTLTRSKRNMDLTTLSAEKVYDGLALDGADETSEFMTGAPKFERKVEGETYLRNTSPTIVNVTREEGKAVAVDNDTTYDFFTADGYKTTYNYAVTYHYGELLIKPRPLAIRTATLTREYNGDWLVGTNIGEGELGKTTFEGLADGQQTQPVATSVSKIRDVLWTGEGENRKIGGIENTTDYRVFDGKNSDTTNNYDITWTYGTLTVTTKKLEITTLSATKTYDADPLDGSKEGEWQNGKPVFDGLVAGETYQTDEAFTVTDVSRASNDETNADYKNILTQKNKTTYKLYSPDAEGDPSRETTGNYEITYRYGELKIEPRRITVTTEGAERQYDGTALTKREKGDYSADNLVETYEHFLALDMSKAEKFGTVTDVMDSPQKNELYVLVMQGETNVTLNYEIAYSYGNLIVNPREIVVTTAGDNKEYDGTALTKRDGFNADWLYTAGGHELVLDMSRVAEFGTVVNVAEGEVDNVLYFKVQLKGGTEEQNARVNANYKILPPEEWGKLYITAKTITVRTETKHFTYDGAEHEWHEKSCDEQVFLDSTIGETKLQHVLVADTSKAFGKVTYVWDNEEKNNKQYYFVYPANHEANSAEDNAFINQNYTIEYVYGDLVVDERDITITAITAEKTYDGFTLYGDKGYGENTAIAIGGEGYADGETAKAIAGKITEITDVQFNGAAVTSVVNGTQYDIYSGTLKTTENYNITLVPGTLKINQRNITLKTLTAEKIYDGTPLDGGKGYGTNTAPTITGEGLADGENYEVVESTGIVNVRWKNNDFTTGEIVTEKNTTTYRILKADGTDSTDNYNITKEYGTLKILQRKIAYTTPTATHEYDGAAFYAYETGYSVDFIDGEGNKQTGKGLALATHKLALDGSVSNPYSTITNVKFDGDAVASIDNEVYYIVVDDKGDDITANYLIIENGRKWGKLTVTPRRLQITTNTTTWVYEDKDLSDAGYKALHFQANSSATDSAFTFVDGHALEAVTVTTVNTVCANVENACTYRVMHGTNDVSYNYDLAVIAGKLTVTTRPITVTSGSDSWTYNGNAHKKLDGFTWTELGEKVGLLTDHVVLVATAEADAPSITHFRENRKENNVLTFKIVKNGTDLTANYAVTTNYGTIAIEKAEVTIVLSPIAARKYNGEATVYPTGGGNYEVASSTVLVTGETLEVAVFFTKDKAGKQPVTPILAGTYYAHLDYDNCKVTGASGETDATDYAITAEPVEFVITENGITVETATKSGVYDGEPFYCTEFTDATVNALKAMKHSIAWDKNEDARAFVVDVKKLENGALVDNIVDNKFGYIIYDEEGNDVTKNFEITEVWGKISVTARTVTVITATGTHEYDGEAFSYPEWEDDPSGLLTDTPHGHYLEWDKSKPTASVLTVYDGEKTNTFSVLVKNASGEDISYNYDIVYQNDGTIQITPRQIKVTVNSANKTYDGSKLADKGATAVHLTNGAEDGETALLGSDELVATGNEISVTNVYEGTVTNTYVYEIHSGSNDVSRNYKIVETVDGELYITPLAVEVTLSELANTVYGDTVSAYPAGAGNYKSLSKNLVNGETLEVKVYFTLNGETVALKQAGAYQIILDNENCIIYQNGTATARGIENYELTQKGASVEIEKRQIELGIKQLANATKVYDGAAFVYENAFGSGNTCYTVKTLNGKEGDALAAGESLAVALVVVGKNNSAHTELLHADEYTVSIDPNLCSVTHNEQNLNGNYVITATGDHATYTVTQREIVITLSNDKREYNGEAYEYTFKESSETGYEISGLLEGATLSAQFAYTKNGVVAIPKNAGVYSVAMNTADGTWYVSSERETPCETSDYRIKTASPATITIDKRSITVTVTDWEEEYKAADFSFTDVHYTSVWNSGEGDGFVCGDETGLPDDSGKYVYEFRQNGSLLTPRNVGEYTVTVVFDESLKENYTITNPDGKFTVIARKITVTGLYENFTYNADKLDASGFSFTSAKDGETGFLGNDKDAYTATYTVTYNGTDFAYKTEVIHGGDYGIGVTVTTNDSDIAKNYEISYEDGSFTVNKREINATRDGAYTKVYDKTAISTEDWNFVDWFGDSREEAGFLLDSERQNAQPVFVLYKGDGSEKVDPVNAGEYLIKIQSFTSKDSGGLLERDYAVVGGEEQLTIEKFLLIIKPDDYSELNLGKDIELPEDCVILYTANADGNDVEICTLPEGDSITVTGDAVFTPGVKRSQKVYIADYQLEGDEGVTENYRVFYTLNGLDDADKELLGSLGIRSNTFFRGTLTCVTRTIVVKQILKDEQYRTLVTTGSKQQIPLEAVGFELMSYNASYGVDEENYGLLNGHEVRVDSASVQKAPQTYEEWLKVKIFSTDDEADVTKGYDIILLKDASTYITVTEISLGFDIYADMGALVTESGEKPKNGEVVYLKQNGGSPTELKDGVDFGLTHGELLEKHFVEFKAKVEGDKLVGLIPSPYKTNSKGVHMPQEDFYDINSSVFRYTPYITADSATKVYDGTALTCKTATASWLLPGHTLSATINSTTQVTVGTYNNHMSSYKIFDEQGNDVTDSYATAVNSDGKLTITKRPLYVTSTPSQTFTYNGKEQSFTEGIAVRAADGVSGFVGNHKIITAKGTGVTFPTGSGVKNEIEITFIAPNAASRTNYLSNYEIVFDANTQYGYLNVLQRTVTISVQDAQKEYDGKPLALSVTASGLLTELGHSLQWNAISITKPSESTTVEFREGMLRIVDEGGANVTAYYKLDYDGSEEKTVKLTVTPRKLTLTSADKTKEYDGKPLQGSASLTSGSLVAGDSLTVTGSSSLTDKDSVTYQLGCRIADKNGNDITNDCYEVTCVEGTLTVTAKAIRVTAKTLANVEYGNTPVLPMGAGNYAALSSPLASGESLAVVYFFTSDAEGRNAVTPKNAGTYYVWAADYVVYGGNKNNYSFTCTPSTVEITQKTISLALSTGLSKEYDGEAFEYPYYDHGEISGAYEGEILNFSLLFNGAAEAIDAGSYVITLGSWSVTDGEGNDVSENYAVNATNGSLTVEKCTVTLNIGYVTKEYDGEPYEYGMWNESLVSGATLTATVVCTQNGGKVVATEVGYYGFAAENVVVTGDKASNYQFVVSGLLTITEPLVTD